MNHHGHSVERGLSVKDDNIAVDKVALNLQSRFGVAVAIEGRQSVFNTGSLTVNLVFRTAAMRASNFQLCREGFGVGVVGLGQFVHPSIVDGGPLVVHRQLLPVLIDALKVVQGRCVVDDIGLFLVLVHATQRDLLLNHQSGGEVGCWKHGMEIWSHTVVFVVGVHTAFGCGIAIRLEIKRLRGLIFSRRPSPRTM